MGTFLGCVGKPHIPEDRQEEFQQRMLRLFREGGMMCDESAEMFGKKITLLYAPELREDGHLWFNYNYFEDDCWEDAGMHDGSISAGSCPPLMSWRNAAPMPLASRTSGTLIFPTGLR